MPSPPVTARRRNGNFRHGRARAYKPPCQVCRHGVRGCMSCVAGERVVGAAYARRECCLREDALRLVLLPRACLWFRALRRKRMRAVVQKSAMHVRQRKASACAFERSAVRAERAPARQPGGARCRGARAARACSACSAVLACSACARCVVCVSQVLQRGSASAKRHVECHKDPGDDGSEAVPRVPAQSAVSRCFQSWRRTENVPDTFSMPAQCPPAQLAVCPKSAHEGENVNDSPCAVNKEWCHVLGRHCTPACRKCLFTSATRIQRVTAQREEEAASAAPVRVVWEGETRVST